MAGLEFARDGFQFNANMGGREVAIDPRLVEILDAAAEEFPLRVVAFSGVAARGSTQNHPAGEAIDILILDRDGMPLANFNNAAGIEEYEEFAQSARRIQQQLYPELDDVFRWGGYFNRGGADLMHFDVHSGDMAYGDWDTGFDEGRVADIAAGRNLSNNPAGFPNGNIRYTDGRMGTQVFQPDAYADVVDYFGPAFDFYQQYGNQPIVIENLQRQLQRRGYFAGEVDGIFGAGTQAAFANFIRDRDMPQPLPNPYRALPAPPPMPVVPGFGVGIGGPDTQQGFSFAAPTLQQYIANGLPQAPLAAPQYVLPHTFRGMQFASDPAWMPGPVAVPTVAGYAAGGWQPAGMPVAVTAPVPGFATVPAWGAATGGGYSFADRGAAGFGYPAYGTTGLTPGSGF
ncbi:MAG: peptidoglycan-binding protein [Bauldia sp.]|nr:peptidoglycan-binding protein [Bauldia sp.]